MAKTHFTWIRASYEVTHVDNGAIDIYTIELTEDRPMHGVELKRKAWQTVGAALLDKYGEGRYHHSLLQATMK